MHSGEFALYGLMTTPPALKLSITTKGVPTMTQEAPLIHPGVILLEDWLKPMGLSQYALAKDLTTTSHTDTW